MRFGVCATRAVVLRLLVSVRAHFVRMHSDVVRDVPRVSAADFDGVVFADGECVSYEMVELCHVPEFYIVNPRACNTVFYGCMRRRTARHSHVLTHLLWRHCLLQGRRRSTLTRLRRSYSWSLIGTLWT